MRSFPRIPLGCLLLLLFVVVPAVELLLLVLFTMETNLLVTLAVIVLTGVIGASVAKSQGVLVLYEAQRDLSLGKFPAVPLLEGLLLLVAGALLLAPGLLTDLAGLSVLVPPVRRFYAYALRTALRDRVYVARQNNRRPRATPFQQKKEPPPPGEPPARSPFEDRSPFGRIKKKD